MARDGPDTATSDFFVCVGPQPELDFGGQPNPDGQGFAAFGRVVASQMGVVKRSSPPPTDRAEADADDQDPQRPPRVHVNRPADPAHQVSRLC